MLVDTQVAKAALKLGVVASVLKAYALTVPAWLQQTPARFRMAMMQKLMLS
jgi:hypothetical protein